MLLGCCAASMMKVFRQRGWRLMSRKLPEISKVKVTHSKTVAEKKNIRKSLLTFDPNALLLGWVMVVFVSFFHFFSYRQLLAAVCAIRCRCCFDCS